MSSRRGRSPNLRSLVERAGIERIADRFDRTPATIRRWLRDGVPASSSETVEKAWERSERASYAAQVRAERQAIQAEAREAERLRRSEAAKRGRETRRRIDSLVAEGRVTPDFADRSVKEIRALERTRTADPSIGPLHGRDPADRQVLRAMVENADDRWTRFLEHARSLGFSDKDARNEFFSPKML